MAVQTANEVLLDAQIRHQTYLLRYSNHVRNRVWSVLDSTEADIAARIRDKLSGTTGLNTPVEVRRMEALLKSIAGLRNEAWNTASAWLQDEMLALAYQEPIVLAGLLQTASPVVIQTVMPTARMLRAIVMSRPFEGALLQEWASDLAADDLRRIHAAIQMGMVAGESADAITSRVVGTGALNGEDGVLQMTRRQVQAVTRTAVQHVANTARDVFMQENAEVMLCELFVATLDSRTTPVCRANDGKRFEVGKGPRAPLHIACRSLRVGVLDGEMLGMRPAKPVTQEQLLREYTEKNGLKKAGSRADLPRGKKGAFDEFSRKRVRELTGRVPASTPYQTWLRAQSVEYQQDTLGIAKSKLFRDGGLTLDKFVAADGTELTLGQLAARHASAFRAAGLNPAAYL